MTINKAVTKAITVLAIDGELGTNIWMVKYWKLAQKWK